MNTYQKSIEIRWADLDPNFHVLHSKYYDIGAYLRMSYLTENGLTPAVMLQHHIGPIIFREECIFKKEIRFGDPVMANLQLSKCRRDASRWSMVHEIYRRPDELAAITSIDGAWIDTRIRKLATPPDFLLQVFDHIPKTADFVWLD
jgi:acyl-CoA thioester hydrolase